MFTGLAPPDWSWRMYVTSPQISWSLYWAPKAGIAVKPRPFFVMAKSCASLFSFASLVVRSVAGGYVVGPNTPRPSPFAPWHEAHDPVKANRPDSLPRARDDGGLPTDRLSRREMSDTAAFPYQ